MVGTDTITLYRGEPTTIAFAMVPQQSIAGWTIELTLLCGARVVLSPANLDDPTIGTFSFVLSTTDAKKLVQGNGGYAVWRIDTGSEQVLAAGTLTVTNTVRLLP